MITVTAPSAVPRAALPRAPRVLSMRDLSTLPPDAVYVGRPTRWGNPFKIGRDGTRAEVLANYLTWVKAQPSLIAQLAGKDLVCWCDPLPCHGHILLRLANDIQAAVTGGRYEPKTRATNTLTPHQESELLALLDRRGVSRLAHGAAVGYDRSTALCVTKHRPQIEVTAYPTTERIDGDWPGCGHRRNRRMLRESQAQILIALPGGGGTANCVSEALVMGLEVWEWRGDANSGRFVEKRSTGTE